MAITKKVRLKVFIINIFIYCSNNSLFISLLPIYHSFDCGGLLLVILRSLLRSLPLKLILLKGAILLILSVALRILLLDGLLSSFNLSLLRGLL